VRSAQETGKRETGSGGGEIRHGLVSGDVGGEKLYFSPESDRFFSGFHKNPGRGSSRPEDWMTNCLQTLMTRF
jgi:hypothetical protein